MTKRMPSLILVMALLVSVFTALFSVPTVTVNAHDGEDHHHEETTNENYEYTVQPGDSYTKIARKAVQTYGIENSVNLSGAEIIFAETNLTLEAKSPILNEGQKVSISKELVKKWVEEAQKLDDATEARWNRYVPFVDFNTDAVGEPARS